jgi:hypothetical protein
MARAMNRPRTARPLADLLRPALKDALKAQGFAAADILRHWPDIAGERLAAASLPVRLIFPPRPKAAPADGPGEPATLVLKVESGLALEVEMSASLIVERINAMFGWRCVGRLRIRQGTIRAAADRTATRTAPLAPAETARLEATLSGIEEDGLRGALDRLGRAVMSRGVTRA